MFVDRCLSFFFWPLCCLSFFNLRILIIPLLSSDSSYSNWIGEKAWIYNWHPFVFVPTCLIEYLRNKSWKPESVLSFNMGWRILVNFIPRFQKLKTHSGFHDLFRFWYVYEYKYGSILWWEESNLYLRLRTMSHTIYAAKFAQMIIHQHAHLRRESQSNAPAHVQMKLYPIDNSLVC
jgi:hypothetical protein